MTFWGGGTSDSGHPAQACTLRGGKQLGHGQWAAGSTSEKEALEIRGSRRGSEEGSNQWAASSGWQAADMCKACSCSAPSGHVQGNTCSFSGRQAADSGPEYSFLSPHAKGRRSAVSLRMQKVGAVPMRVSSASAGGESDGQQADSLINNNNNNN
eukprot:CAMPEP_0180080058 /NCGR_PEP_ID=MMETSP0985-20121206/17289_1 /TAXON_ID=483367 /ORGANISM="non described non described, Strain CCMP 2436" /LENGTH=154 /DNA_ID=CAMNT_0022012955 /DNA_START=42 /DNA_END=507 /DNA_ORIENTATION=-